jgi:ATP-dependent DNA ligase
VREARTFAEQNPAVLLAFDVPRHDGEDLTGLALRDRRARLETLLGADPGCIQLISQIPDVEEAEDWLRLPSIEGVVAKRADGRYLSGQREWVKVKHRRTADCVVIGVAGDRTTPWLVLGLRHADLRLHHLGRLGVSSVILIAGGACRFTHTSASNAERLTRSRLASAGCENG